MSATTRIERSTLPAAGTWQVDPSHSTVGFVARHLMVTKVRGRFSDYDAAVVIGDDPSESSVEVAIRAGSIDTRSDDRDAHLRGADFLDVENHPEIRFRSTGVRHVGGDRWALDGELTVKQVTRTVTLDVEFEGTSPDPWGGERAGFTASAELDREEWGLTWNVALETGGVLVGRKVKLELEVQLVRQ